MLIGYARTSTVDQEAGLEAQQRDLTAAGCERVFAEQVSSVAIHRPQLAAALAFVREGDALMVTRIDRLARSTADLLGLVDRLQGRKVGLVVLSMGGGVVDTRAATGKLLLTMLGAIGEFERVLMHERQREGIAKAKAAGAYKGRKPTAQLQADVIVQLRKDGVGGTEIARQLGIGRASVYRVLDSMKPKRGATDRKAGATKADKSARSTKPPKPS